MSIETREREVAGHIGGMRAWVSTQNVTGLGHEGDALDIRGTWEEFVVDVQSDAGTMRGNWRARVSHRLVMTLWPIIHP